MMIVSVQGSGTSSSSVGAANAGAMKVVERRCSSAVVSLNTRLLFLTLLFISLPRTCVRAQNTIDAETFFALTENTISPGQRQPRQPFRAPWIENSQVRTETRDFDLDAQRYTLRLAPSSPRKFRAQTALANLREGRPDFNADEAACDHLRQRYEDWLDLYLITEELALASRLNTVYADRKTVLERMSATLDFDWSELVTLIREQGDLELRNLRLGEKKKLLLARYQLEDVTLGFDDFPQPPSLDLKIGDLVVATTDPELAYEMQTAATELALEQAEKRQVLDFIQAEYTGPHEDPFRERFSVGVGFQFSNSGSQQLKIRKLELELDELRQEDEREHNETAAKVKLRRNRLFAGLAIYRQTTDLLTAENAELTRINDRITRREGFNPLPLLSIQERIVKNAYRELNERQQVLELYLEANDYDLCNYRNGELWRK